MMNTPCTEQASEERASLELVWSGPILDQMFSLVAATMMSLDAVWSNSY